MALAECGLRSLIVMMEVLLFAIKCSRFVPELCIIYDLNYYSTFLPVL